MLCKIFIDIIMLNRFAISKLIVKSIYYILLSHTALSVVFNMISIGSVLQEIRKTSSLGNLVSSSVSIFKADMAMEFLWPESKSSQLN